MIVPPAGILWVSKHAFRFLLKAYHISSSATSSASRPKQYQDSAGLEGKLEGRFFSRVAEMGYMRNELLGRAILGNLFDSLDHSVIFVEQRTKNFKPISAQYIWNNYGIATPPGLKLLTCHCVMRHISWLLS
jgi:hypothetical protein